MSEFSSSAPAPSLEKPPSTVTPAPVIGQLDLLPFGDLSWEDFERVQWRVLRDVEGLINAQIYGDPGQAQHGLDVIASSTSGSTTALQSKKYEKFTAVHLKTAITTCRKTSRPFAVDRLVIGVSCEARSTGVVEALREVQELLAPLVVELWDARELSEKLRDRADIVIQFFGIETAKRFCLPFQLDAPVVPSTDVAAFQEALALTPEITTGAGEVIESARAVRDSDPEAALGLVEHAQKLLRDAGFAPQAAAHEELRSELLVAVGRPSIAARQLLEEVWNTLDRGSSTLAQFLQRRFARLPDVEGVSRLARVAETAIRLYLDPMVDLPDASTLLIGDSRDSARLCLLAGESALADRRMDWLERAEPTLVSLLSDEIPRDLQVRLRLLIAEASDDWPAVLDDAIRGRLGNSAGALVAARYARVCAHTQRFQDAETFWKDAVRLACLASRWDDAGVWVQSGRSFRFRWKLAGDEGQSEVFAAIRDRGHADRIVPVSDTAFTSASADARNEKWRAAAISARRALRDAVTSADWVAETEAHRLLSDILIGSGEVEAGARHLVRGAETSAIDGVLTPRANVFIDVISELDASNYWTVGTGYRFLAAEGDVIPDVRIAELVSRIRTELDAAEDGTLVDFLVFAQSRLSNAFRLLAAIANRLPETDAEAIVAFFERQEPLAANTHRYWDEMEATTVAEIARHYPELAVRAVPHLAALLARAQSARNPVAIAAIVENLDLARDPLTALAVDGSAWAQEVLSTNRPDSTPPLLAAEALDRLTSPLIHVEGVYSVGTGARRDANLVLGLPPADLVPAVAELLARAADPRVAASDRSDYLTAAAPLSEIVRATAGPALFQDALQLTGRVAPTEFDAITAAFQNPLGSFQFNAREDDTRQRALFVAATLATSAEQRAQVTKAALPLLGAEQDYWLAKTLELLGDAIDEDLGLLSGQGWALRSLAAMRWARNPRPPFLGEKFAADPDVRVRRSFARELAITPARIEHEAALALLRIDPAFSVRAQVPPQPVSATQ